MATDTANESFLTVDMMIAEAIRQGVKNAFAMCDLELEPVAVASIPHREPGVVTGMVGVHGKVSGFVILNMSERAATHAVGGLLQDEFNEVTSQVVDGVGEIANILAGGVKMGLNGSPWQFSAITVPSVIIGQSYQIAFARGLNFTSVTFRLPENDKFVLLEDSLVQVSLSLIRL